MRALLTLIAAGLVLLAATGLYGLKHRVEARRAAVQMLERGIEDDSAALRVLEAEWAYLANPQRVQDHVVRYLRLAPPRPGQVAASLAVLPYRGEGRRVDGGAGMDLRLLPEPRHKPEPPADRPRSTIEIAASAAPEFAVSAAVPSFASRMQRALERAGATPPGDRQ